MIDPRDEAPEPSNVWMADELEPLDRAVLGVLAAATGAVTLTALEIVLAPAAAADRYPRDDIRGAACMLDALRFADIVGWDNRGQPSIFRILDQGREALASLGASE